MTPPLPTEPSPDTGPLTRPRRPPAPLSRVTATQITPTNEGGVPDALDSVQGALALDLTAARPQPPLPELALVRQPSAATADGSVDPAEVRAWAARFAQAVVEVIGGDRPVTQLLRWAAPRVYSELDRRVRVLAQTGTTGVRRRSVRPQLRSVHVFQPCPGSAEVSVHVRYGQRSRALAARLEVRKGRWTCTDLQLG